MKRYHLSLSLFRVFYSSDGSQSSVKSPAFGLNVWVEVEISQIRIQTESTKVRT